MLSYLDLIHSSSLSESHFYKSIVPMSIRT
jgi:hypothetical protein